MKPKPCRCKRYPFPHRYQIKCAQYIYEERDTRIDGAESRGIDNERELRSMYRRQI